MKRFGVLFFIISCLIIARLLQHIEFKKLNHPK
jgi:hypothetical protein